MGRRRGGKVRGLSGSEGPEELGQGPRGGWRRPSPPPNLMTQQTEDVPSHGSPPPPLGAQTHPPPGLLHLLSRLGFPLPLPLFPPRLRTPGGYFLTKKIGDLSFLPPPFHSHIPQVPPGHPQPMVCVCEGGRQSPISPLCSILPPPLLG